jgi:hypothetical protein
MRQNFQGAKSEGQPSPNATYHSHITSTGNAHRIVKLRAEVGATQAKLDRLRHSLGQRQTTLNRLLAESAMNGAFATARTGHD